MESIDYLVTISGWRDEIRKLTYLGLYLSTSIKTHPSVLKAFRLKKPSLQFSQLSPSTFDLHEQAPVMTSHSLLTDPVALH